MSNLWVDDERQSPGANWVWARTAEEAVDHLRLKVFDVISLDHDLGSVTDEDGVQRPAPSGLTVAREIWQNQRWPRYAVYIHSMNPVGAANMLAELARYAPPMVTVRRI